MHYLKNLDIKSKFILILTMLFIGWMSIFLIWLNIYKYVYISIYAIDIIWFIILPLFVYTITMASIVISISKKVLMHIVLIICMLITTIAASLLIFLGIVFGFGFQTFKVQDEDIIFIRIDSLMDHYYEVHELNGLLTRKIEDLNGYNLPYELEILSSEEIGNQKVVKIKGFSDGDYSYLHFEYVDGMLELVGVIVVN